MIAAFLCGLMFGALAYRAWWVKPRTLKAELEGWGVLSDEALTNFERQLGAAPYDSGTISVPHCGTISVHGQHSFGVLPVIEDWKPVEGLRRTSSGETPI